MKNGRMKYWLALSRLKGVPRADLKEAVLRAGGAKEIFDGEARDLSVTPAARSFKDWDGVARELDAASKKGARIVSFDDPEYPALLKEIPDPPMALYAKGRTFKADAANVAVVGTRKASTYGNEAAGKVAAGLAAAGISVVSGMARGCDTAAHKGALSAEGFTVAVLGTGIDVAYPGENKKLYAEIAEKGLVVTEFPLSTPPHQGNFPARNRIIAGMSLGVVVAEAPLKSGAMMTAKFAIDYSREVFAMPGQAGAKNSGGVNKLIKEGAALVEDASDVILSLFPGAALPNIQGTAKRPASGMESKIDRLLDDGPLHIDQIAVKTGLDAKEASSVLLGMELHGLVEQLPGKVFARRRF